MGEDETSGRVVRQQVTWQEYNKQQGNATMCDGRRMQWAAERQETMVSLQVAAGEVKIS